jgi:hypothetical protein
MRKAKMNYRRQITVVAALLAAILIPAHPWNLARAWAQGVATDEQATGQTTGSAKAKQADKKRANEEAPAQTFVGTVEWEYQTLSWDCDVPNCDHFALFDDAAKRNYHIDDSRAALPLEGKRAKVTGVLDPKTHTIHLRSIEPAK